MRANVGKFDTALDEAIYSLSLDGGPDEEVGSSTEAPGTWGGLMRDGAGMAKAIRGDRKSYPNVSDPELDFLASDGRAGAIVTEETQGFVRVHYYKHNDDLERDWKELCEDLAVDDDEFEGNPVTGYEVGDRVQLHPATDAWMRGDRYGEVVKIGRDKIHVKLDKSGRTLKLTPRDIVETVNKHRKNSSIADRRARGEIEGLTKSEIDSMEIQIPTFDWKQVGGDMDPGAHGGIIGRADGDQIELIEIQPVREHVGDSEAADVGHPFWSKEGTYDLSDLSLKDPDVAGAIEYTGLGESLLDMTPEQRGLAIAEACLQAGYRSEEGPAGWAKDVIGDLKVEWWGSNGKTEGWEYLADEDDEFRREVLGEVYELTVDGTHASWSEDEDDAIEQAQEGFKIAPYRHYEVKDSNDGEVIWDSEWQLTKGERVDVESFTDPDYPDMRSYPSFVGTMMEDGAIGTNTPGGWDALSVQNEAGDEVVVRSFSISKRDDRGPRFVPTHQPNRRHRSNPKRYPTLMQGNEPMSQLLDMAAESIDPSGRGHVPDEVKGELSYTDRLVRVVTDYENALADALQAIVQEVRPADDATSADLFDDEGPYLVLMTLMGHGVGIWDGSWDAHYPEKWQIEKVQALLKKKLGRYADDTGGGSIPNALEDAVYEAMRRAGYGIDDEGYVELEEGEEVGYEFQDTELSPERVEEIVNANQIPLEKFWSHVGGRRPITRGEVDAAKKALGGRFARNASNSTRWHVFLNGEIVDTIYESSELSKEQVRKKLLEQGFDPRIVVEQPPARRTQIPPHYRATTRMTANEKWTRAYVNRLPDSAFLHVEHGGQKDAQGKTVPRSLRHFPYKDLQGHVNEAHLNNALSRIPQSDLPRSAQDEATRKAHRIKDQLR